MSTENQIVEQKTINLYEKEITAVVTADNKVNIHFKQLVEFFGYAYAAQLRRIQKDERFNVVQLDILAKDNKYREVWCLPLEEVEGWIFTLTPSNASRPGVKKQLIEFGRELIKAVHLYFNDGEALNPRKYAPNTIKEGEPVKPLSAEDLFLLPDDPEDAKWWLETNNILKASNSPHVHDTDYYTHVLYQRMRDKFGRPLFYEPQENDYIPLTKDFFSYLVNNKGWTKDCFIYRYPAYIRNTQDFKEWCEWAHIKPPARYSCPDERNQREITKQHLIKYKSKQEMAYIHKTTVNCVNSAIKYTKSYIQAGMDQYRNPADNNLPYHLYIGGYRFKQKGKFYKGEFDACGNPNCKLEIVGPSQLHVHHRHYRRVGQELVDDLIPLCDHCHREAHLKDFSGELRHNHPEMNI